MDKRSSLLPSPGNLQPHEMIDSYGGGDGDKQELDAREFLHLIDKQNHVDGDEITEMMVDGLSTENNSEVIVEAMQDDFVVYMKATIGMQDQLGVEEFDLSTRTSQEKRDNFQSDSNGRSTVNDVIHELCTNCRLEQKLFTAKLHFLPVENVDWKKSILADLSDKTLELSDDYSYFAMMEQKNCDVKDWISSGTWMRDEMVSCSNITCWESNLNHVPVSTSDLNEGDKLSNKIQVVQYAPSSSLLLAEHEVAREIHVKSNVMPTDRAKKNYKINSLDPKLLVPTSNAIQDFSLELCAEDKSDNDKMLDCRPPEIFTVEGMSEDDDEIAGPSKIKSNPKSVGSSVYHPAHTESLMSNDYDDDNDDDCSSCLSGIDSNRQSQKTELMKCEGMKVLLELNDDFDGDRDGLNHDGPIEMDVLWANRMYIKGGGEEGEKMEMTIPPKDLLWSIDTPHEDVLQMKLKREKHERRSRGPHDLLPTTFSNNIETRAVAAVTRTSVNIDDDDSSQMNVSTESLLSNSEGESNVSVSSKDDDEAEEEASICDVEYMGRWDIFWPLMTRNQRQMIGAPSDIDVWCTQESIAEQPEEEENVVKESSKDVEIVEIVDGYSIQGQVDEISEDDKILQDGLGLGSFCCVM